MKTRTSGAVAVLAVTALAAAGCGSSKSSTASNASKASSAYPGETTSASGATKASTTPAGAPASGTGGSSAAAGTTITVKHASKLGTILAAGPKRMTVYLFEADKGGSSACSGPCAAAWPPVTTGGAPLAHGAANSTDLGTITRADGTKQVTYKGHPLYYFVKDKDSGDAYGEGVKAFGAPWYALSPKGSKIDNS